MASVEVSQASPDRVPVLASLLGRAFVTEAMVVWAMGGDNAGIAEQLAAEYVALDEVLARHGLVWEAGDALGAAVWVSPGAMDVWTEGVRATFELVPSITPDGGRRHKLLWDWVEQHVPDERCGSLTTSASNRHTKARASVGG